MSILGKLQSNFKGFTLQAFNKSKDLINLSPGPAQISPSVIKSIANDINGSGQFKFGNTPLEISHRSPEFAEILESLNKKMTSFMRIPDEFQIIWTQGGGHGQFAAIPLNMRRIIGNKTVYYGVNGTWSNRAFQESKQFINSKNIFQSFYNEDRNILEYNSMPIIDETIIETTENDSYLYLCSNETVNGIEFQEDNLSYPDKNVLKTHKLIVDMSSDFLMKSVDWNKIDVAFACSSKNMGVAGSNIVIIRRNILESLSRSTVRSELPSILDWELYSETNSLYNTPSTFNLYLTNKLLDNYIEFGNIDCHNNIIKEKGDYVYNFLDSSSLFKACVSNKQIRSNINIPFLVNDGCIETRNKFLHFCYLNNIVGLRTRTPFSYDELNLKEPLRMNIYNGISLQEIKNAISVFEMFEDLCFRW